MILILAFQGSKRDKQWSSIRTVVLAVAVDVFICLVWSSVSPLRPSDRIFHAPHVGEILVEKHQCSGSNSTVFIVVLIAYKAAMTLIGAIFAFRVQSIGESYSTALSVDD
jgi:hypothetical protein